MKMLVVGAGSVGGFFGGRLAAKDRDVTFLARDHRHRIEADQIIGDLIARARARGVATRLLEAAHVRLKVYETD